MARCDDDSLARLRARFPWPSRCPPLPPDPMHGWFGDGNRRLLSDRLSGRTKLVVELGSWLGLSTRWIANMASNASVIAIDHWLGSSEHHADPRWAAMLPNLYDSFLAACWSFRRHIIPIRKDTVEGMTDVAEAGLTPDLIYVDAAHETEAVLRDLETARQLWPDVQLVGDDWTWNSVRKAVEDFHGRVGGRLEVDENAWALDA